MNPNGSPRPMLPNGRVGEAMGEPFRVWEHPPGIVWQGVVLNHKLIPVEAATLRVAP